MAAQDGQIYALGTLDSAVHALAVGQGDVRTRLMKAHRILCAVSENDFPEDLVEDWRWIQYEWTKFGERRRDDTVLKGAVENTLDRMKNPERVEVAKRIYSLADNLRISVSQQRQERRATPTGTCWCGCGEPTRLGKFFVQTHDGKAYRDLCKVHSGSHGNDGLANILLALGYDDENGVCCVAENDAAPDPTF